MKIGILTGGGDVPGLNPCIRSVTLSGAKANPEALAAIRGADAVIYGPGSFYTSVLPHLLVSDVVATIAHASAVTSSTSITIGAPALTQARRSRG